MAHSIVERIRDEVRTLALARQHLSLWTERGLPDYSCSLHSAGTTYWNTLGAMLDFDAIVEMPAPQIGPFAFAGDDVRSDSLWFDRSGHHPIVVVEFERYTRQTDQLKLSGKVDNLLLAYHRWDQQPQVLVLSYWTKGLAALPNHEVLRQRVSQGFTTSAQERVDGARGCELLFFQTVLSESEFGRWRLSEIRERGQI